MNSAPLPVRPNSDDEFLAAATEIASSAADLADEIDRARALPSALLSELTASGLLRAGAPEEVEGAELNPATSLRCAEAIAQGNAAAGWCVSIAITSSLLVAYLPEISRTELFGAGRGIASGVWAPRGRAQSVPGGVVVSGQWPFCSGITHADYLFAGCIVEDGPVSRHAVLALPASELTILDTWHTLGLRGTGSHDTAATDLFVPTERVIALSDGPVIDRPLYRFPIYGFFAASVAAASLGNARAAVNSFVNLAGVKSSNASKRTLAERQVTQNAVGTADAALEAARAYYYQSIATAWTASQADTPVPAAARIQLRLAATHAARTSANVVKTMYDLAGGGAIYDASPLQRQLRDAFTATAHFQVNDASYEVPGRTLLNLDADVSMM